MDNNFTNGDAISMPKLVGVIYSEVKREYFPTEAQYLTEKTALDDAKTVAEYLEKLGIKTTLFPGGADLPVLLKEHKPEMVLNLVGSVKGNEYLASAIPGILELLAIPYTGAGILGEALAYNKFLVKKVLEQNGVPVPFYQLFNDDNDPLNPLLRFPLISKLNEIHGAVELTQDAVSENEKHLRERLKYLIGTYHQPVLVEEYIVGREITAYLLDGLKKKVYLGEKIFNLEEDKKYVFADFDSQWVGDKPDNITYQKYNDPVLTGYIKKAFEVLKMADYGKFDVRLDNSGRYFVLDANSNPFFGPKEIESPMAIILEMYGVTFCEILRRLILNTMKDFSVGTQS